MILIRVGGFKFNSHDSTFVKKMATCKICMKRKSCLRVMRSVRGLNNLS